MIQLVDAVEKYIDRPHDKITVVDGLLYFTGVVAGKTHHDQPHMTLGILINLYCTIKGTQFLDSTGCNLNLWLTWESAKTFFQLK